MTPPDTPLDRARALIARMTPGPWGVNTEDESGECIRAFLPGHAKSGTHIATCDLYYEDTVKPEDIANAAGIVFSRNFTRSALSEEAVRRGASAIRELRRKLKDSPEPPTPEEMADAVLAALVEMGGEG